MLTWLCKFFICVSLLLHLMRWMNAADDNCKAHWTSRHAHSLPNSALVAVSNKGHQLSPGTCLLLFALPIYWYIHLIRILILHIVELPLTATTVTQLWLVFFGGESILLYLLIHERSLWWPSQLVYGYKEKKISIATSNSNLDSSGLGLNKRLG